MKKTIAVIFGGRSVEHDVSIITAHTPIIQSLLARGQFDVCPIYIAKDGSWYSDPKMNDIEYFKESNFEKKIKKLRPVSILLYNGFKIIRPDTSVISMIAAPWSNKIIKIDLVFPAMHGTYGEDGSLMGLLRMANIPFVGCDLFASAVAMDKVLTKQVLRAEGVPTVSDIWFTRNDWETDRQKIWDKFGKSKLSWPLFVKPVHLGSSIGMSRVSGGNEDGNALKKLEQAIEVALHYDEKVLIEEAVPNLVEVTLPIMGNDNPMAAEVERPLNKADFFDYNEKYMQGGKKAGGGVNSQYSEIPADIGGEMTKRVKDLGLQTYKILGCSGIARVDFLINGETKEIFVNEVNPLPGSLYVHNWKKFGVSGVELVTKLVSLAEERFASRQDITYAFNSNILKKSGGHKLAE